MIGSSPEMICRCLDDIRAGKVTADECFARYPEAAAELAGLLQVVKAIAPAPRMEPDPLFRVRTRSALLNTIVAERAQNKSPLRRLWTFLVGESTRSRRAEMPVSVFLALSILTGGSSAGVAIAAQDAFPGDALYPIKAFGEVVQVTLAPSDDYRTALHLTYASRRLSEMEELQRRHELALVEQTTKRYNNHLDEALRLSADRPTNSNVAALVGRITLREQVLAQLRGEVAGPALPEVAVAIALTNIVEERTTNPTPQPSIAATPVPASRPQSAPPMSASAVAVAEDVYNIRRLSSVVETTKVEPVAGAASSDTQQELVASITEVSTAVNNGKPELAVKNLHAFAGKLNALQQSGRISEEGYNALFKSYADTAVKMGATAVPAVARDKPNKPSGNPAATQAAGPSKASATATAGTPVQPAATPQTTGQATATAGSAPQATAVPSRTPNGHGTPGTPSSDNMK